MLKIIQYNHPYLYSFLQAKTFSTALIYSIFVNLMPNETKRPPYASLGKGLPFRFLYGLSMFDCYDLFYCFSL